MLFCLTLFQLDSMLSSLRKLLQKGLINEKGFAEKD